MAEDVNVAGETMYEKLYRTLWKNKRVLYYNLEIDDNVTDLLIVPILLKNIEEENIENPEPITIWLNTNGGDVMVTNTLIEVMQNSRIPINVRVIGRACSAGLLITLAGKHRTASKEAIFLLHDGQSFIMDSGSKARDTMDFLDSLSDKVDKLILERSKLTELEYEKIKRKEFWCFGDRALELGFIDELV